jgi:hypothetical protein
LAGRTRNGVFTVEEAMKLLILSAIHGNWPALEAVLQAKPDFDAVAFCGNVVDYGPCPVECIHWLRYHTDHLVRGNHDGALAFDVDFRCMRSFREYSLATRSLRRAWHHCANCSSAATRILAGPPPGLQAVA